MDAQSHLLHGDFNKRNTLLRCVNGRWSVPAILDWEFAVSGTPPMDFGNFLRYERASRPLGLVELVRATVEGREPDID